MRQLLLFCAVMIRLNSENFWSFHPYELILILKSSACGASKIITNGIKIGTIPWDFNVENKRFHFWVSENKWAARDKLPVQFKNPEAQHLSTAVS